MGGEEEGRGHLDPSRFVRAGAPRTAAVAAGSDATRTMGASVVANLGGTVGAVDAATGTPLGRVAVAPVEPAAVAVAGEWAWAPRHGPGGGLTRVDANVDGDATTIPLPDSGFALAVADGTVWVSGLEEGLFAVDTTTGEVRLDIDLPGAPRGVAVANGRTCGSPCATASRWCASMPTPARAATLNGQLVRIEEPKGFRRCRMAILNQASAASLHPFVTGHVEPGTTAITDAWQGYSGIDDLGCTRGPSPPPAARPSGGGPRPRSGAPWTRPPQHRAPRPGAGTPGERCAAACAVPFGHPPATRFVWL